MKKGLRMVSFITLVLMCFSLLFTGCAPSKESAPAEKAPAAPSAQAPAEKPAAEPEKVDWPKKPVQIYIPASAGGDTDFTSRTLAKYLEKELGQPFIITNMPGGGGAIATKQVFDANPDGYSVYYYHLGQLVFNLSGTVQQTFNDFEIVAAAANEKLGLLAVKADSPYKNLQDLIAAAKAKPETVKYATQIGGFTYLQALIMEEVADVKFQIVDIGPANEKNAALLGGHVDVINTGYGNVKALVESGDFRILCIFADERSSKVPEIPTAKEQGVDMAIERPFVFYLPKGTPAGIVDKFSAAVKKVVLENKDFAADIEKAYKMEPYYLNSKDAKTMLENYMTEFKKYESSFKGK
ncbi:MAG: tripartite tricarboxylate transporter substrate binding protein [Clostridia bacterium]